MTLTGENGSTAHTTLSNTNLTRMFICIRSHQQLRAYEQDARHLPVSLCELASRSCHIAGPHPEDRNFSELRTLEHFKQITRQNPESRGFIVRLATWKRQRQKDVLIVIKGTQWGYCLVPWAEWGHCCVPWTE
jgi:hypothetical protein